MLNEKKPKTCGECRYCTRRGNEFSCHIEPAPIEPSVSDTQSACRKGVLAEVKEEPEEKPGLDEAVADIERIDAMAKFCEELPTEWLERHRAHFCPTTRVVPTDEDGVARLLPITEVKP
jgi:hypothetical protein